MSMYYTPRPTEQEDRLKDQLSKLTGIFSRADSVLARRQITVKVNDSELPAPAWSTANEITFNSRLISKQIKPEDIVSIKGLNIHEVAHILYTPRNTSSIARWVIENDCWQAFNALEDQRIETLLVGRFPSIATWLTATMVSFIIDNPQSLTSNFPLVRGRRYLPVEVRAKMRASYKNPDDIQEICDVVDEYRMLLYPNDTERAKDLIFRFNAILKNLNNEQPDEEGQSGLPDPYGHSGRPSDGIDSGEVRPATKKEQERDRDRAINRDKADEGEQESVHTVDKSDSDEQADSGSDDSGSDDVSDTDLDDVSDIDSDGDDDFDEQDYQSSSSSLSGDSGGDDDSTADTPSTSAGNASDLDQEFAEQVLDQMQDILSDALKDVKQEVEDLMRELNGDPTIQNNGSAKPATQTQYVLKDADLATSQMARAFGHELERLRADSDPGWERGVSAGRINPLALERGDDWDYIYDRWSDGLTDATDIECVILLDNSSSMAWSGESGNTNADMAYRSMWAIKRSLDAIEANTTVMLFNSSVSTLYEATERATLQIKDAGATGGTAPQRGLAYAKRIFAESSRAIKLLFIITDGQWGSDMQSNVDCDQTIRMLGNAGVLTALASIGGNEHHHCDVFYQIDSAESLALLGREVVRTGIARQLANN